MEVASPDTCVTISIDREGGQAGETVQLSAQLGHLGTVTLVISLCVLTWCWSLTSC